MKNYAKVNFEKSIKSVKESEKCDFIFYKADGSTDKNIGVKPIDNNLTSNIKFGENIQ